MTRARVVYLCGALAIALVVLAVAWYWSHPRISDTPLVVECDQYYATARSHADTIRIDGLILEQQGRGRPRAMTCGALRAAYAAPAR